MNLHLLRIFKEVADHGSFTLAARKLNISQPAVSKGVRDFEAQLGSPLLERGSGGVRPTFVGSMILERARTLFGAEAEMEEVLRAIRGIEIGRLAIAASKTIASYYLPPIIGEFHMRFPHVDLDLHSANTQAVSEMLKERRVDIALVEGPVADPEFIATPWRSEQLVPVVGPAHRFRGTTSPVEPDDLSRELILLREMGSGTREVVLEALTRAGVHPARTMEVNSIEAIIRLASSGVGVAIVSSAASIPFETREQLFRFGVRGLDVQRMLSRLSLQHRQPSATARAFNDLLDQTAS
jgi:DNA-binding transcriptional LysR family regulator